MGIKNTTKKAVLAAIFAAIGFATALQATEIISDFDKAAFMQPGQPAPSRAYNVAVSIRDVRNLLKPLTRYSGAQKTIISLLVVIALGYLAHRVLARSVPKNTDVVDEKGKGKFDSPEFEAYVEEHLRQRTTELTLANERLKKEIAQRPIIEGNISYRLKQLGCFYGLSRLVERPNISLEQIFQESVHLVHDAYQYPELTCVRITFDGIQYKTDNFEKTELSQYAQIKGRAEKAGTIEVYYLGQGAKGGQSPFIKEERDLLNAIAEHLSRIAERRHTGEKLELLRNLTDRSNDCIFIMEPKWGRLLDANDRACVSLGYTREELLNMAFKDIEQSIPDDSSWQGQVEEFKLKEDLVIQGQHKRKDGTTFFAETSLKLVSQKKKDFIIAIARDITERKQAEENLRQSEKKYRILVENLPQRIFLKDRSSVYLSCNENYAKDLGIKPEEIAGKTDYEFHLKELAEKYREDDKKLVESGETEDIEEKYIQDRREIIVHTVKTPVKDNQGNITGILGIFWDITEQKKAEQRQAELLERLEKTNQELKDFAYIVSHDLKAPLRGIKTLADWLSADYADKFDEDGKEQMQLLSARVDRMHNLIDGVLQYSKVGRTEQQATWINLNELMPDVIDMVAPPGHITVTVENELPVVKYEETRIMQVFSNLLSNAIKYMDKPQGWVKIGCVEEDGFWKFSISDNGPGIEEKYFDRIFRIFQTLSARDKFESTGIGLTVTKKIVQLYGGKIWLESKVGEGSTFFFTLPKQEKEIENATSEAIVAY